MKNIKKKREAKGMTQEQLAKEMSVDTRTVQRWEEVDADGKPCGKVRACYHTDLARVLA